MSTKYWLYAELQYCPTIPLHTFDTLEEAQQYEHPYFVGPRRRMRRVLQVTGSHPVQQWDEWVAHIRDRELSTAWLCTQIEIE